MREVGVGQVQVGEGVDVDALDLVHHEQADPPADPVVLLPVDRRPGEVERAVLVVAQLLGAQLLAARAVIHVVVGGRRVGGPPEERRLRDDPDQRVDTAVGVLLDGPIERAGQADR
ncbi:hypothetical protein SDC9_75026 [bioreactor metagenome]|uniref:Uncharacterized protein n=1 Tax=bioreactor metagenome TaxID=1076179 RepID=A0A644YJE0_9ZZZZ